MKAIYTLGVSLLEIVDYYYFLYSLVDTNLGTTSSKSLGATSRRINRLREPVDL